MTSDPGTLTLTWTPRAAELADASLRRNKEVGGSGTRALLAVLVALVGATMFTSRFTFALGLLLILMALVLVSFRMTASLQRRRWAGLLAGNPTLAETCEVVFDEAGVHLSSERLTSSRTWSGWSSWSDVRDAMVLSTSDTALGSILVVPHRAATGEQLTALRGILERHLGPPYGDGPGKQSRPWLLRAAVVAVLACAAVPLAVAMNRVHDQGGEWRPWPSEAPPLLHQDGRTYVRDGGPTGRPTGAIGIDYTPGGGLVMVRWPEKPGAPELWVLSHSGVVRHYRAQPGA